MHRCTVEEVCDLKQWFCMIVEGLFPRRLNEAHLHHLEGFSEILFRTYYYITHPDFYATDFNQ